jgi:DNA-binding HxlR family transcriptional regulator
MGKNNKNNNKRIKESQGEKSRQIGSINELDVLQALVNKPLTFSELLNVTEFSKPVLWKHLKTLMKKGYIYKDTIKLNENPEEVGKIVYRHVEGKPNLEETLRMRYIEYCLKMPKQDWSEESKVKVRQLIREIAKVYSKESSRQRDK